MTGDSPTPTRAAARLKFTKAQHLRSPADFDRVYAAKRRASDHRLLLFAAPNSLPQTRLGLSVSRKHGNAVRRHHLKRLLREAFRLAQHDLPPGLDLIAIPTAGGEATVAGFRESLEKLAIKLRRRIEKAN